MGIKIRGLFIVLAVLALAVSVLLLIAVHRTGSGYTRMQEATEEYITCRNDASQLQAASDFLTEQVRAFAVTGDAGYVAAYFEEAAVTRRRDAALDSLREHLGDSDAYGVLSEAMDLSNGLMDTEYGSMRLTLEARGLSPEEFCRTLGAGAAVEESALAALNGVSLSDADLSLSKEGKLEKAAQMVFNDEYQNRKQRINALVSSCMDVLLSNTRARHMDSQEQLHDRLRDQNVFIIILVAVFFALMAATMLLVIRPLKAGIAHIGKKEKLPMRGAYELRYLAATYNRMFDINEESQNQLSYEASHDALTGLYNRRMFEKMRVACDNSNIAMMIIDIDKFKEINDSWGHDVGDKALKKVSALLHAHFRAGDYVCRIGGDEFAVIMLGATSGMKDLVEEKINDINGKLSVSDGEVPAMTISVGVAFGDRENPTGDIFKDADSALYGVKNNGRNGCAFY